MTLVDTTVWIDYFAGLDSPQTALIDLLIERREDLCVCGVVMTEVLQGIRSDREHARTQKIFEDLLYQPMERETFLLAARITRTLRAHGITIRNTIGCMIAAVCIESGARLLHNDRDFDRIASQFPLMIAGKAD
jgi:predicted nucleic acid-binding protein